MLCMLIHHELTSLALYWSIDVSTINVELQTFKKKKHGTYGTNINTMTKKKHYIKKKLSNLFIKNKISGWK